MVRSGCHADVFSMLCTSTSIGVESATVGQ